MLKRGTFLFLSITGSLVASVILFVGLAASGSAQQTKERIIKIITFRDPPVEIVALTVKGTLVQPDQRFHGDSDWFNGLTVTIKNVSDKPVVYTGILVTAPHEKNGMRQQIDGRDYVVGIDLMYGVKPVFPGEAARSYRPVPLAPGQTADIMLSDMLRDQIYSLLRNRDSSTDVSELTLRLNEVVFEGDDNTMWRYGYRHRRDPANPMRWNVVDPPRPKQNHRKREAKSAAVSIAGSFRTPYFAIAPK